MYTTAKNPVWANEEHTLLDIEVNFNHLSEEFVCFTTSADADTPYGQQLFEETAAGTYGAIGAYVAPPVPTSEQLAVNIRGQRDGLLTASDWTQLPDVPQTTKDLWATYRQALRDITGQSGFPQNVTWPTPPQ
jgi:hypothetical protein